MRATHGTRIWEEEAADEDLVLLDEALECIFLVFVVDLEFCVLSLSEVEFECQVLEFLLEAVDFLLVGLQNLFIHRISWLLHCGHYR